MKQFGGDIGVMKESRKLKVHDGKKRKERGLELLEDDNTCLHMRKKRKRGEEERRREEKRDIRSKCRRSSLRHDIEEL